MSKASCLIALLGVLFTFTGCLSGDDDDNDVSGDDDTSGLDCATCEGDYSIENSSNLEDVSRCESIGGDLMVYGADWLSSLELPCLESVDGHLHLGVMGTTNMPALTTVGGDVNIGGTSIDMPSLATVGEDLHISSSTLPSLDMPGLTSVGGTLVIGENVLLGHIGLVNLTQVEEVSIAWNDALSDFDMLNLVAVSGDFGISGNPSLINLDGLSGLASVGDDLSIRENACLGQDLAVAFSLAVDVGGDVTVEANGFEVDCQ